MKHAEATEDNDYTGSNHQGETGLFAAQKWRKFVSWRQRRNRVVSLP